VTVWTWGGATGGAGWVTVTAIAGGGARVDGVAVTVFTYIDDEAGIVTVTVGVGFEQGQHSTSLGANPPKPLAWTGTSASSAGRRDLDRGMA